MFVPHIKAFKGLPKHFHLKWGISTQYNFMKINYVLSSRIALYKLVPTKRKIGQVDFGRSKIHGKICKKSSAINLSAILYCSSRCPYMSRFTTIAF